MSGLIMTSNHPKALWPGVKLWFGRKYAEHAMQYPVLFDQDTSSRAYEEIVQITDMDLVPVKPQGKPIEFTSETQGQVVRFSWLTFALGYAVTWEELQDNLYPEVSKSRSGALAFAFAQTKERFHAAFYNNGFDGTNYPLYDGKALFATDNPRTSGGTYSNTLSTTADLSEAAMEDVCIQIMQMQSDKGHQISAYPVSLHVAPYNFFNAHRIYKSVLTPDTANNAVNALVATNALPKGVHVNNYFTNQSNWFVRTSVPGLLSITRNALAFDQDNEYLTKNALASGIERYGIGCYDKRSVVGVQGP